MGGITANNKTLYSMMFVNKHGKTKLFDSEIFPDFSAFVTDRFTNSILHRYDWNLPLNWNHSSGADMKIASSCSSFFYRFELNWKGKGAPKNIEWQSNKNAEKLQFYTGEKFPTFLFCSGWCSAVYLLLWPSEKHFMWSQGYLLSK